MKNLLIIALLALNCSGCVIVAKTALSAADKLKVPALPVETDLGCKRIVNEMSVPFSLTKGQKEGLEPVWLSFYLILDEERAAESVTEFKIDLNKEIPLIQNNCIGVSLICGSDRECYYQVSTIPRSLVDRLGGGKIASESP